MSTSLAARPAPASQAVEYGGFRFPLGAKTTQFNCTPVKDATQRTIIYNKWLVQVEAELNATTAAGIEAIVKSALALLNEPGQSFLYQGRPIGDFTLNVRGATDCLWGPFPQVTSLEWHGPASAKITWTVEFHAPTCLGARFDGPCEFAYGTSVSIDAMGLTTRTYKGFIRIAQNRLNPKNRRVQRSADEWRTKINPPLLAGFRRIPGEFSLSEDKCRLDFSIRDEELPSENVPPENVVQVEADAGFNTSQPGRIFEWNGWITATYTLPKRNDGMGSFGPAGGAIAGGAAAAAAAAAGVTSDVASAVRAFRDLVDSRVDKWLTGVDAGGLAAAKPAPGVIGAALRAAGVKNKVCILPLTFAVSEPAIYGHRAVRFDMRFRVAGASLIDVLNYGGLWKPVPGSDWQKWVTSIKREIGPGGVAGVPLYYGEEDLVDLCAVIPPDMPKPPKKPGKPKAYWTEQRGGFFGSELRGGRRVGGLFPPPEIEKSWIAYEMGTSIETDSGIVIGKTLPLQPLQIGNYATNWDALAGLPTGNDSTIAPADSRLAPTYRPGETFVHQRTTPTVFITLEGHAVRAGFPIPTPTLTTLGGAKLVACNRPGQEFIEQAIVGQAGTDGSIPIYGARWVQRYVVVGQGVPRGPMPVAPNPVVA